MKVVDLLESKWGYGYKVAVKEQEGSIWFYDGIIEAIETIQDLPNDWNKYRMYGCDSNGGNYCTDYSLIIWNSKLWLLEETAREYFPGEEDRFLVFPDGDPYITCDPPENTYYTRVGPDATIREVTYEEWLKLKERIEEEEKEYNEWLAEQEEYE